MKYSLAIAGIVSLLAASAVLIAIAPLFMESGYSMLRLSISETAAQGLRNAWIARLGFLAFGFAVIWLALVARSVWSLAAVVSFLAFGVLMTGAAAFSHRPWQPDVRNDAVEDLLHSIAASGMGLAFTIGVIARLIGRGVEDRIGRLLDLAAAASAVGFPLAGQIWPEVAGLMQRVMFGVAYVWFIREALFFRGSRDAAKAP